MTALTPALVNTRPRRTPTVLQLESVECGAASLAMVLGFYGRHEPLESLRLACGVTRDGSKAGSILRAARGFGLDARGYKKEPGELAAMRFPIIVFWNFNHFLVVEGFHAGRFYLNDPARGRRTVSAQEFDQGFTGVALAFEPGAGFRPGGIAPSVARSLSRYIEGVRAALAFLVMLGLALVVPGMLIPVLSSRFIDEVLVAHAADMVVPLLGGLALTAVARAALAWLQARQLTLAHAQSAITAASRFFSHALRLPAEFYTQRSAGEIASRVDLNERVADTVSGDLSQVLLNCITAIFFLVMMFAYERELALIAVVAVVAELVVWRVITERTAELSQHMSVQAGKLAGASVNGLANIESIKASAREDSLFAKWMGLQTQFVNSSVRAQGIALALGQLPSLLSLVVNLAILGIGSLRIIEGEFTVGGLVAFQTLLASFTAPVHALLGLNQKIQTLRGDLTRLDDVLNYPADSLEDGGAATAVPAGGFELREVSFGYNRNDPPLIENFSLTLAPGRRVAIVGASGCGKSTLARLVAGLYRPWSGTILFDGRPRGDYARASLASSLAFVDQDVVLFEGTIRDNLAMWDPAISDAAIEKAARDACIHDVVMEREGSYAAQVQEGGRNWSGGQRQRLEIARALAANPRTLVLDEATSALDAATERAVQENLRSRGCACLIVAHRLSTVRDADEIIVLDRGRVVERGRHDALIGIADGHYARLIASGIE
jgi:NHLM bacteriocin system ABC transporter peptidase/ATP-binding protein